MEEQELIIKCKRGEKKALEILYKRYSPKMLALCRRYSNSQMEAEDILQEAFIKVFTKIHTFKAKGTLEKWIKRIIINTALSYWRKNRKLLELQSLDIDSPIPAETEEQVLDLAENISIKVLYEAIGNLPEKYRYVFNMYALEGYSHKDIARLMDIQESTSRSQYTRARKKLVQMLKHHKLSIQ